LRRLRRAGADERQQIKWFLYAAVPLTVFANVITLNSIVYTYTTTFRFRTIHLLSTWTAFNAVDFVVGFALLVVPVFTYIAILK
jgi:hypothetical protein